MYKGLATWAVATARQDLAYQKGFLKLAPAREGSEHQVMVSHVVDPGHVFVQRIGELGGYAKYINPLVEEVETTYSGRMSEAGLQVLVPRVGMACVAQLSMDKKHYRARVIAMMREGRVEVQFVDLGNTELTLFRKMFKILDKFLTLQVMATPVSLAGIVPEQWTGWGEEATQVLREMTMLKELWMFVDEEKNGEEGDTL